MSENEIISKENYENEELSHKKIIFHYIVFEQIKGKELYLSIEKILEIPTLKNWFKRQKEEYYVVSQKEHVIDCKYTSGKAYIPIIRKRIINKEIQDIKNKASYIKENSYKKKSFVIRYLCIKQSILFLVFIVLSRLNISHM